MLPACAQRQAHAADAVTQAGMYRQQWQHREARGLGKRSLGRSSTYLKSHECKAAHCAVGSQRCKSEAQAAMHGHRIYHTPGVCTGWVSTPLPRALLCAAGGQSSSMQTMKHDAIFGLMLADQRLCIHLPELVFKTQSNSRQDLMWAAAA
jgi:hypothetical protein